MNKKTEFYLKNKTDGDDDNDFSNVKNIIKSTKSIMIIMRGLPGSGKSYMASKIKMDGVVLSADNFFINNKGVYTFDKRKLNDAHLFTKQKAKEALSKGVSPIIIDNTNIKLWEFEPYIKMACENNYEVKLIEPNTPWKDKIGELVKKNRHNVPYEKLKQMKIDFESNIDLNKLSGIYRNKTEKTAVVTTVEIEGPKTSPIKTNKPKSSGLLFGENENVQSFLQKNGSEWCMFDDSFKSPVNTLSSPISTSLSSMSSSMSMMSLNSSKLEYSNKEVQTTNFEHNLADKYLLTKPRDIQPKSRKNSSSSSSMSNSYYSVQSFRTFKCDRSCDTVDLDDCLMKSKFEESINTLNEMFAMQFEKSYLMDLLIKYENDLNVVAILLSENIELNEELRIPLPSDGTLKNPAKLSDLCTTVLENMNRLLVRHYSNVMEAENIESLSESESIEESGSCSSRNSSDNFDNENTFQLKLNKNFAKALFDQFADVHDTFNENDSFNVDCDLNLAFEIFKSWKKTRFKRERSIESQTGNLTDDESIDKINEKIRQFEADAQLALEIEHENMYHPIDGIQIHLVNSATVSLRSIMAEQRAEQKLNSNSKNLLKQDTTNHYSHNPTMAIRLKRRQLHETYPTMDEKVLDEIFFKQNYNASQTCKYIECQFGVKPTNSKIPNKNSANKKNPVITKNNPPMLFDYSKEEGVEYRELAHDYYQVRQKYFEKASEAHQRGWGGVAQYYAEMGREQNVYMKNSNNNAAVNIFAVNNADLNTLNTLDLHGLHVSEALEMFKEIYFSKKDEYKRSRNNKKKKYLYVITGCGRHSLNKTARLRPKILSHLIKHSIKYEEPNIGLFRIDLA